MRMVLLPLQNKMLLMNFLSFDGNILGKADLNCDGGSESFFQSLQLSFLTSEMQTALITEVTNDEIIRTVKGMPHNKFLGPDGYTVKFFLATWDTVGPLFIAAVKEFFTSGKILKQLNSTVLTLVSKISQPSGVTDFRTVACCNITYKCISKILANRLKKFLHHLICSNHIAFIEGRRIMNNVLLA